MSINQIEIDNFLQDMRGFFRTLSERQKDISEDLKTIPTNQPYQRICDFGCGDGLSTLNLTSSLVVEKAFGIDKYESNINRAKLWGRALTKFKELSEVNNDIDTDLQNQAAKVLALHQNIEFKVGDVSGNELPSNLNIAYCNLLLVNIYNSAYENQLSGISGVEAAIENISKSLAGGGYFLAIEQYGQGLDFNYLFEKVGLKGNGAPFNRNPITTDGRASFAENRIRYVYRKGL